MSEEEDPQQRQRSTPKQASALDLDDSGVGNISRTISDAFERTHHHQQQTTEKDDRLFVEAFDLVKDVSFLNDCGVTSILSDAEEETQPLLSTRENERRQTNVDGRKRGDDDRIRQRGGNSVKTTSHRSSPLLSAPERQREDVEETREKQKKRKTMRTGAMLWVLLICGCVVLALSLTSGHRNRAEAESSPLVPPQRFQNAYRDVYTTEINARENAIQPHMMTREDDYVDDTDTSPTISSPGQGKLPSNGRVERVDASSSRVSNANGLTVAFHALTGGGINDVNDIDNLIARMQDRETVHEDSSDKTSSSPSSSSSSTSIDEMYRSFRDTASVLNENSEEDMSKESASPTASSLPALPPTPPLTVPSTSTTKGQVEARSSLYTIPYDETGGMLLLSDEKAPWASESGARRQFVLETESRLLSALPRAKSVKFFDTISERFSQAVRTALMRHEFEVPGKSWERGTRWRYVAVSKKSMVVRKCMNCLAGWYSVSIKTIRRRMRSSKHRRIDMIHFAMQASDLIGLDDEEIASMGDDRGPTQSEHVTHEYDTKSPTERRLVAQPTNVVFDVIVPYACRIHRLTEFARTFPRHKLPAYYDIRLLVTNFQCDEHQNEHYVPSENLKFMIMRKSGLGPDQVFVIDAPGTFSRAKARNVLHQYARHDSIMLSTDVDMLISPSYFVNAEALVVPGVSAYFPIVWSTYEPQSRKRVACFRKSHRIQPLAMCSHDIHASSITSPDSGDWRPQSSGTYAMSGSDAKKIKMDTTFVGWGGEDTDFMQKQVLSLLHVVRMRDMGLKHIWHHEDCRDATGLQSIACAKVEAANAGSKLGLAIHVTQLLNSQELYRDSVGKLQRRIDDIVHALEKPTSSTTRQSSASSKIVLVMYSYARDLAETVKRAKFYSSCGITVMLFYSLPACERVSGICDIVTNKDIATQDLGRHFVTQGLDVEESLSPLRMHFKMMEWLSDRGDIMAFFSHVVQIDSDVLIHPYRAHELVEITDASLYAGRSIQGSASEIDEFDLPAPFCMAGAPIVYSTSQLIHAVGSNGWSTCLDHAGSSRADAEIGRCLYEHFQIGCNDGVADGAKTALSSKLVSLTNADTYDSDKKISMRELEGLFRAAITKRAISFHPLKDRTQFWAFVRMVMAHSTDEEKESSTCVLPDSAGVSV